MASAPHQKHMEGGGIPPPYYSGQQQVGQPGLGLVPSHAPHYQVGSPPMPVASQPASVQVQTVQGVGTSRNKRIGWAQHSALRCAIIQFVCGFLALGMGIVSISLDASLGFLVTGIWTGVFFLVTGCLGMVAAKKKNTGFIVAFMVMSILSSLAAVCLVCIEIFAAIGDSRCRSYMPKNYKPNYNNAFTSYIVDCAFEGYMALHILMASIGFVEGIVALASAGLTCRACCCAALPPQTGQIVYIPAAGAIQYASPLTTYMTTGSNVQYVTPHVITTQYPTQHPTSYTNVIQA